MVKRFDRVLFGLINKAQRAFVHDRRAARRVVFVNLVMAVALFACIFFWTLLPGVLGVIATTVVALFAGLGAFWLVQHAAAYRSGWLNGRYEMTVSLNEAMRRGMRLEDWLLGEVEKDAIVLGAHPNSLLPKNFRTDDS